MVTQEKSWPKELLDRATLSPTSPRWQGTQSSDWGTRRRGTVATRRTSPSPRRRSRRSCGGTPVASAGSRRKCGRHGGLWRAQACLRSPAEQRRGHHARSRGTLAARLNRAVAGAALRATPDVADRTGIPAMALERRWCSADGGVLSRRGHVICRNTGLMQPPAPVSPGPHTTLAMKAPQVSTSKKVVKFALCHLT